MSWYTERGRKLRLSLSGSSNGCDRGRQLYVLAGHSLHKERRIWCWLLIIAPKSVESAQAAMVLTPSLGNKILVSESSMGNYFKA